MSNFRWGILSTGNIAAKFAEGLTVVDGAELFAVGSRDQASADAFGERFGASNRHASYEALAADPDVDGIYVATPHPYHCENTLMCLEAGKPVLCEKPFSMNAAEARLMIAKSREKGVFLMEAMWARWNPVNRRVCELIESGAIGEVLTLHCDFGFRVDFDAKSRLFSPELGGGALLDVGIYPTSYARMVFGRAPIEVVSMCEKGPTGTDDQSAWIMRYEGGGMAILSSAVRSNTPQQAIITGSKGRITVPTFWCAETLTVNKTEEQLPFVGNGYNYEAEHFQQCMAEGLLESPSLPLDETLEIIETLDRIRAPWEMTYPSES